jgi:hypothetical protein
MSGFDPSFMNFIVACKTSTTNQLQHQQISYHTRAAADHLQHCTADGENWISLSLSLFSSATELEQTLEGERECGGSLLWR